MLSPGPAFARKLLQWYDRERRDLPWRVPSDSTRPLDPYHVLISEAMLQQTQVVTVIPYFHRFLARFPTLQSLAEADEQEVLRLWQGLGYYSRARNLHVAARIVCRDFMGRIPADAAALLSLPGIGRYTAGAIGSIAFGRRVPILDGNVQRVLCRLDCVRSDPRDPAIREQLWKRAEEILPGKRVGDFNSALMELGATICMPTNPRCLLCPVQRHCQACQAGLQDQIPPVRKRKPTPIVHRRTYCIRYRDQWLIEQRPASGRWASMWQFITIPADSQDPLPVPTTPPKELTALSHTLTHRRYRFAVFVCEAGRKTLPATDRPRAWTDLHDIAKYPLPRPQMKIAELLRAVPG